MKVVNCNINAAIKLQCTYNDAIRALFAQCTNQSTAICRQKICINIEVKYFCDNIIYHYPTSVGLPVFFCKCNAQNLEWNWYGSMEDCLPFHS